MSVRQVIPPQELSTIVSNIGLAPGFSAIFSSNAAPDSGFMMVALKPDHKTSSFTYIKRLKQALSEEVPEVQTFFTSGSIIDSVLNFGLAAPIDIQVSGPSYIGLYQMAQRVKGAMDSVPEVANTLIPEQADYPTLNVKVDRVKAARLGLNQRDVVTNLITALTSNAMIAPSIWIEPKTGNDYFLTAQYKESAINSLKTLEIFQSVRRHLAGLTGTPFCCATLPLSSMNIIRPRPTTITFSGWSTFWLHRGPTTWAEPRLP